MQTGTGLGLAIVNSIVRSNGVDGKVDVWSAEGQGTEIKVTFNAEVVKDEEFSANDAELQKAYNGLNRPLISLIGFEDLHRGTQLLRTVVCNYLVNRWGFTLAQGSQRGDIVILNDDISPVTRAAEEKDLDRAFIILSAARGDPRLMNAVTEYERLGGFCRIVYKPFGPQRLYSTLKLCLHALNILRSSRLQRPGSSDGHASPVGQAHSAVEEVTQGSILPRRYSEDKKVLTLRPPLGPRAFTAHPLSSWSNLGSPSEQDENELEEKIARVDEQPVFSQSPSSPTIAIGTGGTLLKTSVGTLQPKRAIRVLVVEDNAILRNLL